MKSVQNLPQGYKELYKLDLKQNKEMIIVNVLSVTILIVMMLVMNFFVPENYFWVVYIVQMINVSGASGDIYVSCKFAKLKKDVLIQDTGTEMIVYEK